MSGNGFVDLRLNNGQGGDESFWPSFTDIMMVIVLIFLLAMLTLLLKNMDLVHQLRASLAAERAATAQARSTTDINTQLNLKLRRLQEEAAMLRMRLMDLGEEQSRTQARLQQSETRNLELSTQLSAMTRERDAALAKTAQLEQQSAALRTRLAQQQQQLSRQQEQFERKLAEQQQQYQLKLAEIGQLKITSESQLARLKKLQQEYASLESKYKRLIRPARSPLGKVVVMVRYRKQNGQLQIELRGPSDKGYQRVDGTTLHKRLARLQEKYGKKLYVRIVFPDDSGLSYSEAWNLTESLLRLYDYYYQ